MSWTKIEYEFEAGWVIEIPEITLQMLNNVMIKLLKTIVLVTEIWYTMQT